MQTVISQEVRRFIAQEFLEGDDQDLELNSPLLEWGILDSIGMVSLVSFLEERFGIRVPESDITPDNFRTLERISSMVVTRSTHPPALDDTAPPHDAFELSQLVDFGARRTWTRLDSGANIHCIEMDGPGPGWWILPEPGEAAFAYGDIQRAAEGQHRSVAVDLPGFGLSTCVNPEPTFWDHADLLAQLIRKSADSRVVLFGHGLSAPLAIEVALRVPERVVAVVAMAYGDIAHPEQLVEAKDADTYLGKHRHGGMRPSNDMIEATQRRLSTAAHGSFLDAEARDSLRRIPPMLTRPTLWIGGLDDGFVTQPDIERAAASMPAASVKWLARAGHGFPMERPDETVSLVERYLNDLALEGEHV